MSSIKRDFGSDRMAIYGRAVETIEKDRHGAIIIDMNQAAGIAAEYIRWIHERVDSLESRIDSLESKGT